MKYFLSFTLMVTIYFSTSLATAQNKVVVIPLFSAKKLHNVVMVSPKGGDFTSPVAAVNSITTANAQNPYLVVVGPGVYTLTHTLKMKPYVSVAGAGQAVTKLTGAISTSIYDETSAIVSGADNATLCDLTIENSGGRDYSIALYNNASSMVVKDVTATAYGATNYNTGVLNDSSSTTMNNIIASAYGGGYSFGVENDSSSTTMTNVTATASGANQYNHGVFNSSSSTTMTNVTATASDGTNYNLGVSVSSFFDTSYITMTNVTATASGGTWNRGLYNSGPSQIIIRHSTLEGTTDGIVNAGATKRVMQSSIIGGAWNISGTLTCVNSDDGEATELNVSCQPVP